MRVSSLITRYVNYATWVTLREILTPLVHTCMRSLTHLGCQIPDKILLLHSADPLTLTM